MVRKVLRMTKDITPSSSSIEDPLDPGEVSVSELTDHDDRSEFQSQMVSSCDVFPHYWCVQIF